MFVKSIHQGCRSRDGWIQSDADRAASSIGDIFVTVTESSRDRRAHFSKMKTARSFATAATSIWN